MITIRYKGGKVKDLNLDIRIEWKLKVKDVMSLNRYYRPGRDYIWRGLSISLLV